jgi:hypothetical protein
MPIAVTAVMFVFWIAMSYREFQRGDMMLGVIFALVGIVLSAYRVSVVKKLAKAKAQPPA